MVTNLITGFNDNPIVYDNGKIGFDSILQKYIVVLFIDMLITRFKN